MAELRAARSFLFVPGDDERRINKALATRADAVIVDLEDAIHAERKDEARATLSGLLGRRGARVSGLQLVRINSFETEAGEIDLRALVGAPIDGIVVPKAASTSARAAEDAVVPLVPIVETASGLREAFEIAEQPNVARLMFGSVDLAVQLDLGRLPNSLEFLYARSRLVLDSAAAGTGQPVDGVHVRVGDAAGVRTAAKLARALGFGGKACIHPDQVDAVNAVFSASSPDIAWARRVDAEFRRALSAGKGSVLVDGEMVDAPVARRASEILREAAVLAGEASGDVP